MTSFNLSQALHQLSIYSLPVLAGMVLHELAHGWVAYKLGDPTARLAGRLTLNPLRHMDPMGLAFFVFTSLSGAALDTPLVFGWAKPIPVNPRYFRRTRLGMALVALAGATANLLLAFCFSLALLLLLLNVPALPKDSFILQVCEAGIVLNCSLAWFNLLPVPPLDGSKVLACLLAAPLARLYLSLERYGMLIVLMLLATGLLGRVIRPLIDVTVKFFFNIITRFL